MPVVINEFEVIPAPSPQQANPPSPRQAEAPAPLDPAELAKAVRLAAERFVRVWAH
jgi:hypothetical protein